MGLHEIRCMSVKDIKGELSGLGVSTAGCCEKEELVQKLHKARQSKKSSSTAATKKSTTKAAAPAKKKTTNTVNKTTASQKKKPSAASASSAKGKGGTPVNFSDTTQKKKPVAKKTTSTNNNNNNGKPPAKKNSNNTNSTKSSGTTRSSPTSNNNKKSKTTSSSSRMNNNSSSSHNNGRSQRRRSTTPARGRRRRYVRASSSVRAHLTPREQHIQDLLGDGAYHLPGNNWWQDWKQSVANLHPVFSICCQHPLHPISKCMRAVALLGSIMVGLVITNVIYLLVIHDKQQLVELPNGDLAIANDTDTWVIVDHENENEVLREYTEIQLDSGMLVLWTVGSAIHAIWDNLVWYLTSCACCETDKEWVSKAKQICNYAVIIGCIALTAAATLAVIIRAHVEGGGEVDTGSFTGKGLEVDSITNKNNYEFLISYGVELFLAWFFWFPVIETILFSGIVSKCFPCVPCLEGRPQEVRREELNDIEAFDSPSSRRKW